MWTERFRIRPVSHCKEGCSIQLVNKLDERIKKAPVEMQGLYICLDFLILAKKQLAAFFSKHQVFNLKTTVGGVLKKRLDRNSS